MRDDTDTGEFGLAVGAKGSNQATVRAYNERLVLSLVRRFGALAKADIARSTGLSAQTVSVIMRSLEVDGLLLRGEPVRGKVGQPSVPMSLNPDGVYSIGLKIGRRSADLVLMDFVGTRKASLHKTYAYPTPGVIMDFVDKGMKALSAKLTPKARKQVAGIGVAAPFELWNWADEVGAPQSDMDAWRGFDLQAEIAAISPYPVSLQNDATSACGAELVFGAGTRYPDFIYFFIGSFIGGGVVLNSSLHSGRTGNAGAVGSMPVPDGTGGSRQLIEAASIFVLEKMLKQSGIDPSPLWFAPEDWIDFGQPLTDWIELTSRALAHAIVAAASVIDFGAAIIDGGFPQWVKARIVGATKLAALKLDLQGITLPDIIAGEVGSDARSVGGASLPLFSRYLLDFNTPFKEMN
ncbi:MAG: ROK family transcriptional regulator [Rhizobiaceae bacterium]